MHATGKGGDGDRLVRSRAGADVDNLHLVEQRLQGWERPQPARLREAFRVLSRRREYADKIDVGAMDAFDALVVQIGGETGPYDSATNLLLAWHLRASTKRLGRHRSARVMRQPRLGQSGRRDDPAHPTSRGEVCVSVLAARFPVGRRVRS
jgi:hypothetical protein